MRQISFRRRLPVLAGLLCALAARSASAQGSVQWGCDAPVGRTCYFSIQFATGGVHNFSLPSGRKTMVGGVTPGRDQYLVSIDAPNLGDIQQCRQLIAVGRACQAKVVDPSYND